VLHPMADGALLLTRQGRWGRAVEALHLKLRLLADAVASVRAAVEQSGAPLLNLSAGSFRVDLGAPGSGLPVLWTARAALIAPGDAAHLPVSGAEAEYYLRSPGVGVSVYSPDSAGRAVQGRASIRVRKVEPTSKSGGAIVQGTFATQERINPSPSDLTWIRLHVGSGRIDLYGRLESDQGLAPGEWRFRTVPQRFAEAEMASLKAAEGVAMSDAPFQVIPLLSTPCDLYALGVLGVRTLLVGSGNTLPEALDELRSLARQAAEGQGGLGPRLAGVMEKDKRWIEALGPWRVAGDIGTPAQALDQIPLELWAEVVAMLVRMFPGASAESACRDLGDAPPGGLQAVFAKAAADLDSLVTRTRSLIVIDWRYNREVHGVIRGMRTGLAPGARKS
jgi:hypothetical protein